MKMTITKQIGKRTYHFQVEGSNLYEVITQSQKLSFGDVKKCGFCQGDDLILKTRLAQDKYKYTEIKCQNPDCRANLTLGQKQDDPETYFLRRNEQKELKWEKFVPKNKEEQDLGFKRY